MLLYYTIYTHILSHTQMKRVLTPKHTFMKLLWSLNSFLGKWTYQVPDDIFGSCLKVLPKATHPGWY